VGLCTLVSAGFFWSCFNFQSAVTTTAVDSSQLLPSLHLEHSTSLHHIVAVLTDIPYMYLYIIIGLSRCVTTGVAWMDGRSRAAGAWQACTGGKRRAAGQNRQLGRRRGRGLRGVRVQARLGRRTGGQTGKPTAQIEPKSAVSDHLRPECENRNFLICTERAKIALLVPVQIKKFLFLHSGRR